jgi:hypothetical protein
MRDLAQVGIDGQFLNRLHKNSCETLAQHRIQLRRLRADLLVQWESQLG